MLAAAAGTPATPLLQQGSSTGSAYLQSNALFGQEHSSMTPSVRHKEYTPSLSPDMEQLAARAAAAAGGATPLAAPAGLNTPVGNGLQALQQQQLGAAAELQQVWAPAAVLPAVCKAPKTYLQMTGDLFAAPDQDTEVTLHKLVVCFTPQRVACILQEKCRKSATGAPCRFRARIAAVAVGVAHLNGTSSTRLAVPCSLRHTLGVCQLVNSTATHPSVPEAHCMVC
jgi:hypothetical protein